MPGLAELTGDFMVMVVQDSKGELQEYLTGKSPDRPELDNEKPKPKEEAKSEAKPEAKAEPKDEEDETPEFVKRLGLTPEQHKGVTDAFKLAINKKHRQAKEAEDFAAAQYNERRLAEQRAETAERERDEAKKAVQPAKKEAEPPKREDFPTQEAYEDARVDWRADQRIKVRDEEAAQAAEKARVGKVMDQARARIATAISLVPDYEEVTGNAHEEIPSPIASYMQESELFAELGYHFAKNPEDLAALSAMPMRTYSDLVRLGVALDKIQSNIQPFASAKTNGDKPKSTNGAHADETGTVPSQPRAAAPVIQPLNVGSTSLVEKSADKRTYVEERAHYTKTHNPNLLRRSRH